MKNAFRRRSVLLAAVLGLAVLGLSAAPQPAWAAPKSATSHAAKNRGAMTVKISRDQVNNAANVKKGSKGTRGAGDYFHVDNHTDYAVDIYVGGNYKGTVSPYGDLYIEDATGGEYTATASAPGTGFTWGPRSFTTPFTWRLFE